MLCFNLFHPLWLLLAILGGSSIVVVLGDQIIIDEPPNGAAFHAGATIDIRYRGWYSLNMIFLLQGIYNRDQYT